MRLRETISWLKTRVQDNLFPHLKECCNDPLTQIQKDLVTHLELIKIEKYVGSSSYRWIGRRPEDRQPIARAFVAKAVYDLPTTRMLVEMLHTMPNLRMICGFVRKRDVPSESTFSRAFAEFVHRDLGKKVHDALVEEYLSDEIIGHIARDATAIKGNEKPVKKGKRQMILKKRGRPKKGETRPVKDDTRLFLQVNQSPAEALLTIPTHCDVGTKKNAQGYKETWRGYKLHVDTTESGLPITVVLTSASLHDSQVAIPMMKLTSQKVTSLYDLMDSAYDAKDIWDVSRSLGHAPIIDRNPRRGEALPMAPAEKLRYHERTASERLNARLKEEFGARHVMVKGHKKVSLHLMFGIIALFADQLIRLAL
jgi:IS5 family transposase